jgi:nucleoside phosphorylase
MSAEEKYTPSVGILAALVTPELESFWSALDGQGWAKQRVAPKLRDASIDKWTKLTKNNEEATIYTGVIGEKGQATAAIETIAFLDRCQPTNVILCGIAGSLNKAKYVKRAVVVGSAVHWKFQDKVEDSAGVCDDGRPCLKYRPRERTTPYLDVDVAKRLQRRVNELFKPVEAQRGYPVHFEGIFSWDYVASGQHVTARILELSNDVACVEMEAGGFLYSLNRYANISGKRIVRGFVVRGISDYAELKDNVDADRFAASGNAAWVAVRLAQDMFDADGLDLMRVA